MLEFDYSIDYGLPEISKSLGVEVYNHRNKYRKLYLRLIKRCKEMTEEELSKIFTERHHILPKCMGGKNDESNLVIMPIRYHIMAHIVLVEIYPDNLGLNLAINLMFRGRNDILIRRGEVLEKSFSSRTIARIKEQAFIARKILGSKNKGRKLTPEQLKKWSEVKKGEKNNNYGKTTPLVVRKKISEKVKEQWRTNREVFHTNPPGEKSWCAKKVIGPDGTIYGCLKDAVKESGIASSTLRGWMKGLTKNNHGWAYLDPKNAIPKKRIN